MGIITNQWKNASYVSADALIPNLNKYVSGGGDSWNGGAISRHFLSAIQTAGMSWVTREINKHRMAGLSNADDANQSYTDIDLAWYAIGDGTLQIYESGNLKFNPDPRPAYTAGDILEVQLEYIPENVGFTDDFNDNAIDPVKWVTVTPSANGTVAEVGGKLLMTQDAGVSGYNNIKSQVLDLRGREIIVDIGESTGKSYSYHENYWQVIVGAGQSFFLYTGGGGGLARIFDNSTYYQTGVTTDMIKWRFRHDNATNTIYLDYMNSAGTWVAIMNRVLTYTLEACQLQMDCGQYAASGYPVRFSLDNVIVRDNNSGWRAKYYHTDFATSVRTLRYTSERDVTALFPNMRIDTSIYHEGGTIENVQYLGAGWQDEKGRTLTPGRILTPAQQNWQLKLTAPFGGGGGIVVPPVTIGQIYPRGIK